MATFWSGTSNIELVEKNKKAFPPAFQSGSRLAYYSSLFNTLEINSTFYKLPLPVTLEKWALEVPAEFRFTLKVWREITHSTHLLFPHGHIEKFMGIANHMGDKKGALLVQLPASTDSSHSPQLEMVLEKIQQLNPPNGWKVAVEFRHPSWYNEQTRSLLERHRAALVWHDRPLRADVSAESPFIYLRFHGPKGDYKGSYSDVFLQDKAYQIQDWLTKGKNVYAYFNNTIEGDAPRNLMTLNNMVENSA